MERRNCERLCHEEQDLAALVALSVFCSFCLCVYSRLSVYAQRVLTVCAWLIIYTI